MKLQVTQGEGIGPAETSWPIKSPWDTELSCKADTPVQRADTPVQRAGDFNGEWFVSGCCGQTPVVLSYATAMFRELISVPGNPFSCLCVILLTNKQTDKGDNTTSLVEVELETVFCRQKIKLIKWTTLNLLHSWRIKALHAQICTMKQKATQNTKATLNQGTAEFYEKAFLGLKYSQVLFTVLQSLYLNSSTDFRVKTCSCLSDKAPWRKEGGQIGAEHDVCLLSPQWARPSVALVCPHLAEPRNNS